MKLTKSLGIVVMLTPIVLFASDKKCDSNTYEINQCLKVRMEKLNSKLDNAQNHNVANFKKSRDITCNDISSTYEGGSYLSVKYGNCIISLDRWYLNQIKG